MISNNYQLKPTVVIPLSTAISRKIIPWRNAGKPIISNQLSETCKRCYPTKERQSLIGQTHCFLPSNVQVVCKISQLKIFSDGCSSSWLWLMMIHVTDHPSAQQSKRNSDQRWLTCLGKASRVTRPVEWVIFMIQSAMLTRSHHVRLLIDCPVFPSTIVNLSRCVKVALGTVFLKCFLQNGLTSHSRTAKRPNSSYKPFCASFFKTHQSSCSSEADLISRNYSRDSVSNAQR